MASASSKPEFDLAVAAKQKCYQCIHWEPGRTTSTGNIGHCNFHNADRHERYWCDQWTTT